MAISGLVRSTIGRIGEQVIFFLLWLFGRRIELADAPWLSGPVGGKHIGDQPYEQVAASEGLMLERRAEAGGLLPDFSELASSVFDPSEVHPRIRDFYEGTAGFVLDTWATTYFPANIALWLLVMTISRRVDQLNFPLDGLETAQGITSEIVLLRRSDGSVKYTGWFRRLRSSGRAVYTGFYLTEGLPHLEGRSVKVVFPMPSGNATVFLRPENDNQHGLRLVSAGERFGDVGFYRIGVISPGVLRVWLIRSLRETFRLFVEEGVLRCEHEVRFLGFRVLSLHYRMHGEAARLSSLPRAT